MMQNSKVSNASLFTMAPSPTGNIKLTLTKVSNDKQIYRGCEIAKLPQVQYSPS